MQCCSCNTEISTGFATGFLPVLVIKSQTRDLISNPVIGRFSTHKNKFLNGRQPVPGQGFCFACALAAWESLLVTTTNRGKRLLQQGRERVERQADKGTC